MTPVANNKPAENTQVESKTDNPHVQQCMRKCEAYIRNPSGSWTCADWNWLCKQVLLSVAKERESVMSVPSEK